MKRSPRNTVLCPPKQIRRTSLQVTQVKSVVFTCSWNLLSFSLLFGRTYVLNSELFQFVSSSGTMPLNAIEVHRYQLAILFGQLVVQNKAKYSTFSASFLRQQFHELARVPCALYLQQWRYKSCCKAMVRGQGGGRGEVRAHWGLGYTQSHRYV